MTALLQFGPYFTPQSLRDSSSINRGALQGPLAMEEPYYYSPITKRKSIGEFIVTLMNSPITKRCFVIAFSPFERRTSFPSKREESHKARREFFKQTLSFFVCNKRLHYQSTTSCTTIPLPSRSSPHQSWGGHPLRSPRSVLPQQHPAPPLLHRTLCIRHRGREYHLPLCKPLSARE